MNAGMPLRDLLHDVAQAAGVGDIMVHGLTMDSRRVRPGDAFVALRGGSAHGISFAPQAVRLMCHVSPVVKAAGVYTTARVVLV